MKRIIKRAFRTLGADIRRYRRETDPMESLKDLADEQRKIIASVHPYEIHSEGRPLTMVTLEGLAALVNATNYIASNKIRGDIAECGVWRGGSMMIVARTLMLKGDTS